jgi:hypothetical protein
MYQNEMEDMMEVKKLSEGFLKMDVSSEGNFIKSQTFVVVNEVIDNFKNLSIEVISMNTKVRLPYCTNVSWLVGGVQ